MNLMLVKIQASTFNFLLIDDTEIFETPMINMNITSTKVDLKME